MIVAVGSDKGSPGATTLSTVLGLVWPGDRVLCELDPRGADLPFRLLGADGHHMTGSPSIVTLAVAARPGAPVPQFERYAQPTVLGVPVIRGEVSTRATSKVAPHLRPIAVAATAWPGTAIADVGCLQPGNPALVVAKAAAAVLLVTRPSTEGLGRLRERVEELGEQVGDPSRQRTTLGVVLVADQCDERAAVSRTRELLASIGSPAPVVGVFAHDSGAAAALWSGPPTKKLFRSSLVRSGEALVAEMQCTWPELGINLTPPKQRSPAQPPTSLVAEVVMDAEGVARW